MLSGGSSEEWWEPIVRDHAKQGHRISRLRAALQTICEIGESRDVEVARAALEDDKR